MLHRCIEARQVALHIVLTKIENNKAICAYCTYGFVWFAKAVWLLACADESAHGLTLRADQGGLCTLSPL